MAWHIGNTTVRTPYRLRQALIALQGSHLHGNLLGRTNEHAFAVLLHDAGLVRPQRPDESDHSDLGRKWRVALSQLGFLTPHLTKGHRGGADEKLQQVAEAFPSLTGHPYQITPAGQLLVAAKDVLSQQETFLRALAAYRIPSPLERRYRHSQFSPLLFTLGVLQQLDALDLEPYISFEEMALIVQRSTVDVGVVQVAENIRVMRADLGISKIPTQQFYRQAYERAVLEDHPGAGRQRINTSTNTLNDYADLSLRYLKATGLFKSRSRGITVSQERTEIVEHLADQPWVELDENGYLRQLWSGANIPTDERQTAIAVAQSLQLTLHQKGVESEPVDLATLDDDALRIARRQLEAQLQRLDEQTYADQQIDQVDEIVGLIDAILGRGRAVAPDGTNISIPRTEMPAYFEWVIWRAFLAINSLENSPWEARRFEIDQDLLPVGHAPAGGPDMIFTLRDAMIVVEVTLTSSSRQEAAEGEPVRRHVARFAEENGTDKPVYGLFIAPKVDTNTAHTFRSGDWYTANDSKINLHIVPMELRNFRDLFEAIVANPTEAPHRLRQLLMECRMEANRDAPQWKRWIAKRTESAIEAGATA